MKTTLAEDSNRHAWNPIDYRLKKSLEIPDDSASLVVTSPPFLDVVDYQGDNWLRCWFIGVDSGEIDISQHRKIRMGENYD